MPRGQARPQLPGTKPQTLRHGWRLQHPHVSLKVLKRGAEIWSSFCSLGELGKENQGWGHPGHNATKALRGFKHRGASGLEAAQHEEIQAGINGEKTRCWSQRWNWR